MASLCQWHISLTFDKLVRIRTRKHSPRTPVRKKTRKLRNTTSSSLNAMNSRLLWFFESWIQTIYFFFSIKVVWQENKEGVLYFTKKMPHWIQVFLWTVVLSTSIKPFDFYKFNIQYFYNFSVTNRIVEQETEVMGSKGNFIVWGIVQNFLWNHTKKGIM